MPLSASPSLQQRVREFLSTVRVGVDFGEHAGGIAVVRGNEVLHAETFLDFHEATLEQRRILRRGRRSRHAKKMRLARLRSWVLRQKLANGQRLPDPYSIMRNPEYMIQPGVYKNKGTNPRASISWVELAKQGSVDAAGFVHALTLIFQKRGYKWDAIALEEMSDAKLKEFLMTARIPTDNPALADQIRAQIEQRRINPDLPIRGKNKCSPEELESCLQFACERGKQPPRPRVAEHRSVKEADLRGVVDGFARAKGLTTAEAGRWRKELCGLLNKAIRPARFENRLKTGCAWCGRATPRKAKVRELAHLAAVNNLRSRKGFRPMPLTSEERKPFLEWWANPQSAPGADAIAKRILKLNPEQKGMAGQFHDLLKHEKPKGRASLCAEHLQMAAEGKTMKDAGVEWQKIAVRKAPNPCGERRDARVLHRLEQILLLPGRSGEAARRHGPVSTISLEIPDPDTERQAKGKRTERQLETLKERLAKETEGCIYKVLGGCSGEPDKDHIFPRSRGGPDVRFNLVSACMVHNKEKDNRTPFEWLTSAGNVARWNSFAGYVTKLGIPERKKAILLNETGEYPEADPTALARIGSRPRQFVVALRAIFEKRGLPVPRYDYRVGEPLVQQIRGGETRHFRLSWWKKADGSENFPYPKDRSTLFNHAEDAAILAAVPPHTWRERAFCSTSDRPNWNGEIKPRPGLAIPELAPDWAAFVANRERPLVRILGRYPVTWKSKFTNTTFSRKPEQLNAPQFQEFKLVRNLERKHFENIISPAMRARIENIAASVGLNEKGSVQEAAARQLAGENAKRSDIQKELTRAAETLEEKHPGMRRAQVLRTKVGPFAKIEPSDGPARKVEVTTSSEGVIVWQKQKGKNLKTEISLLRPRPLQKFGFSRVDPPIPDGASILGQLHRHQIIWVDGQPNRKDGFYRVTKCQKGGVSLQPEEAVPAEILRRTGIKLEKQTSEAADDDETGKVNFSLGKQALAEYFESKKKPNANGTPTESCPGTG